MNHKINSGIAAILSLFAFQTLSAQSYPTGFSQTPAATGLVAPTRVVFAPDGRIFICQQGGKMRIVKSGVLLTKPFIKLAVDSSGERGLLGVAFDPNFSSTQWVYIYYTLAGGHNNRIIRVKASGDTALMSTMKTILDLDPLSSATNHNGGCIKFGRGGKLFVSVGENANGANSQNLDTYLGKILRINSNGSVPAGNPYPTGSEQRKRVWCYGVRNPYSFDVNPKSGRIFVNDVGENTWEEVDDATQSNKNFGWPTAEGNSTNPAFTNPLYEYNHNGMSDRTGCAMTGGTFLVPGVTNYPAAYRNNYYFLDLCNGWINRITYIDTPVVRQTFGTSVGGSDVGITAGPDGNLYFLSRDAGILYKIVYSPMLATAGELNNGNGQSYPENVKVYPSPAGMNVTIERNALNIHNGFIKIFDSRGLLVKSLFTDQNKVMINTASLANGLYFALVNDGSDTQEIKFEIMH